MLRVFRRSRRKFRQPRARGEKVPRPAFRGGTARWSGTKRIASSGAIPAAILAGLRTARATIPPPMTRVTRMAAA